MKKIIEESGMTLKRFSEYYEIPYNTIRQWYNETRKAPQYIINLLRYKIENEKQGTQLPISKNWYYFEVIEKTTGRTLRNYIFDSEEKRNKMIDINTGITNNTIIFKRDFIEII